MSLYCIRCKCHVIALLFRYAIPIVAKSNSWCDDTLIKDQDDGDHGGMPVTMDIMTILWRWRSKAQDDDGHIMSHILIAYDVYLFIHLILLSLTVAL